MPKRMLEDLRRSLVAQGELCEDALTTAVMAMVECDADLAVQVATRDCEIDEAEMDIDRKCRRLLQHGGLDAHSLRLAVATSKISNDLERIGDLAVHICQQALFLVRERSTLAQIMELPALVEMVGQMIRDSIGAVLDNDVDLAWRIIAQRDVVEDETQVTFRQIVSVLRCHPEMSERCCHLLLIMQNFRNIAELAVNIAEEVIFLEKGKVVRHRLRDYRPLSAPAAAPGEKCRRQHLEKEILRTRQGRAAARLEHLKAKRQAKIVDIPQKNATTPDWRQKARCKLLALHNRRFKSPPAVAAHAAPSRRGEK